MPKSSAISRLRRRKNRLVNTQSVSTYTDEKEKKKKAMMGQLKPGTHALSEIFELMEFGENTPERRAKQLKKLKRVIDRDPSRETYFKPGGRGWDKKHNRPITAGLSADKIKSYRKNIAKVLRKYGFESLDGGIFEYSIKSNVKQLKLPLFKDFRNKFEKQGDRLEAFRRFARKKKVKNPDSVGEKMYYNWAKKHGVKHDEGKFRSILGNES